MSHTNMTCLFYLSDTNRLDQQRFWSLFFELLQKVPLPHILPISSFYFETLRPLCAQKQYTVTSQVHVALRSRTLPRTIRHPCALSCAIIYLPAPSCITLHPSASSCTPLHFPSYTLLHAAAHLMHPHVPLHPPAPACHLRDRHALFCTRLPAPS